MWLDGVAAELYSDAAISRRTQAAHTLAIRVLTARDAKQPSVVNGPFRGPDEDCLADLVELLCLNRYYGWYWYSGDLAGAGQALEAELRLWAAKYRKPIVITEYGAGTMPGQQAAVQRMWTDDYQVELLEMHHRVFDGIEAVIGEHV